ncbi:MAG: AMP-binding protein [Novosphingobium sp.]|nr:AMP-binding protein [Novosphingobium sp.]
MSLLLANVPQDRLYAMALTDPRTSLTWREASAIVDRAANGMREQVAPHHRIGVFSRNCAEVALVTVASMMAGRSAVPINSHLAAGELSYILQDGAVDLLFTGPDCLDVAVAAARESGHTQVIAWRCSATEGVIEWEDWLAAQSETPPSGDLPAVPHLHYTSGTTGRPKAVHTAHTMFPQVDTVADLFTALGEEVRAGVSGPSLAVAPLYHASPMRLVRAFAGGAPLVSLDGFDAEETLATIERYRIERLMMVPTHFRRLLALPEDVRNGYDISSVRLITHTGAACPADVKRAMIEWFGPVLTEVYGGTETGPVTSILSADALAHPGSVGRAAPPYEVLVLDDLGNELPAGEEGRICFRDTTGRGFEYVGDPEKTRSAQVLPGVFTLGEMGYVDPDGWVYITDRTADMIVSGGVNIYPAEIEAALGAHEAVEDVAVIGVPNADMGEEVKALIVPRHDHEIPDQQKLDAWCRERLAGFKCPRSYEFVETVGRTPMGKVNKRELRAPWWPTARTIG